MLFLVECKKPRNFIGGQADLEREFAVERRVGQFAFASGHR